MEQELTETGESYESFCVNVYNCNVWGDDLIAAAIGDMWNIGITILSPVFKKPFHLFHNKTDEPDVVIVSNGGSYMCPDKGSTHFSATIPLTTNYAKPGSEYLHSNVGPDMNPKLMPRILDDKKKARDIAMKEYLKVDTELSLGLLRSVIRQLNRIDDHITSLIKESDDLNRQKDVLTNQLLQLGLSAERIKEITDMKKERQYCRTAEREQIDKANERKRKAEEEKWDKAKKQKVIALVEGEEEPEYEMPTPEKDKEVDDHESKVRRQQKQIIQEQEQLIQRQEQELIRRQQMLNQQEQAMTREPIIVQPSTIPPLSSNVQLATSTVQPGTSKMRTGGQATIDRYLSPRNLEYLTNLSSSTVPCRQVQEIHGIAPPQPQETQVQPGDVVISKPIPMQQTQQQTQVQPQQQQQQTVYVPKLAESSHIVLIATPAKKSTPMRSGLTLPVPEELQDKTRFYCKNCHGNYTTKDELTRHQQNVCGKKVPSYICDACDKTYYWPNPLREHYYKEHVKVIMYHCPRCNKGFNYSNKLSVHIRTKCPNKDGPELYERMIKLDEKLEEKFKPKVPLEIENPEAIQPQEDVQEVEGDEQANQGDEQATEGDEEEPLRTGQPMAQELLQAIQEHEQEQLDLQTPSGIENRATEVPVGTQPDVIILKTDNAEEDDGERLLEVMSQGIIPGVKDDDDEENGGSIKPEDDALLDADK